MPLVRKPSSFACLAERLARTGTGPNRSVVWPAGATKRKGPHAESGEEMALREPFEVARADVFNAAPVDDAIGDESGGDEVFESISSI